MDSLSPPPSPSHTRSERPERPGAVSALSYVSNRSHKSQKSSDAKVKMDMTESPKDKRRLAGKADPTKALSEAQPAAVALEDSNLENLRTVTHRDREGNVIIDPDRSNPTRNRMERPLDTIRSFNAAAEGTTSRRHSYQRPPSQYNQDAQNRRSSYYGNQNNPYAPNGRAPPVRPAQGGYYRNSSSNVRPESFAEDGHQQYQQGPPPPRHGRFQSNQYAPNQDPSNFVHSHQPSFETMTSGSDEMSKSTNPSSQNSSFDQLHQMGMRKADEHGNNPHRQNGVANGMRNPYPPSAMNNVRQNGQTNNYMNGRANGINNYTNGQGNGHTNGYQTDDYGFEYNNNRPVPPPKRPSDFSASHTFNTPTGTGGKLGKTLSNSKPEKRQSWIKRTFSKRN